MLSLVLGSLSCLFFSNWGSSVLLVFSLFLMCVVKSSETLVYKIGVYYELDFFSDCLILLSLWIIGLCLLSSQKIMFMMNSSKKFVFMAGSLLLFLFFVFLFNDFILFYLSFECSVVPVLFLILGWGYQPERVRAGIYLLFYTFLASLPLLILILTNFYYNGLSMLLCDFYLKNVEGLVNFFIVGAFLVKFPMYLVHLWLPKAHVEAPVAGSMILAAVLLKLGGYGLIRFMSVSQSFPVILQSFLVFFSLWGGVVVSISCLTHVDMKALVACSSVVHMSSCIGGLLVFNEWGKQGAIIMMLSHGLCSSGLFFLVGKIYNLTNSRSMSVNKGLLNMMPSMSVWWFLLLASNMACPPTINLLSEIEMISGLMNWSYQLWAAAGLLVFFSCAYSIYLFSLSQHGKHLYSKQSYHPGAMLDYMILFSHWAPLNLFILAVSFMVCS